MLRKLIRLLERRVRAIKLRRMASFEDRVSSLASSLDAYQFLRNRFISTFKWKTRRM